MGQTQTYPISQLITISKRTLGIKEQFGSFQKNSMRNIIFYFSTFKLEECFIFTLYYFFQEEFSIRCREFQQENEFEAILQGVEETRGEEVIFTLKYFSI